MTATEICQLLCALGAFGHLTVILLVSFAEGVKGILGTRKGGPRRSRDVRKETGVLFLLLVYELGPYGLLWGVSSLVRTSFAATMAVLVGAVIMALGGIGLLAVAAWSFCRYDRRSFLKDVGAALGFGPIEAWVCAGFVTSVAFVLKWIF
jgi:hypothetical protein